MKKSSLFKNVEISMKQNKNKIVFLRDRGEITFTLPDARILAGKGVFEYIGSFTVSYPQYKLVATIKLGSLPKQPTDCFE